jgi:hypothetical protein
MKTVLIYDDCHEAIRFFVLDGDYRSLDKVYINACLDGTKKEQKAYEKKQDELSDLMYGKKNSGGSFKPEALDAFPVEAVKEGAAVIVAGFLP